jgi:hypothetical protein
MEASGQFHALAALFLGKSPRYLSDRELVDFRTFLDTVKKRELFCPVGNRTYLIGS